MRVLCITPYVPSLIRVRPYHLLRGLATHGHAVTLLSLAPQDELGDVAALRPFCQRVEVVPVAGRRLALNYLCALFSDLPLQAAYGRSPAFEALIRRALSETSYDVVHIEHLRASLYGALAEGLPCVYDSVDCISLLFERTLEANPQLKTRLMAWVDTGRTRRYEGRLAERFARILVTSPQDRAALRELMAHYARPCPEEQVVVLPNGVDLDYFAPQHSPRRPETLIFTGKMSYHANVASVLYLARAIMPLVWRQRPKAELWIVGKDPPEEVRALAADRRITVTGTVPDLRPYLSQATAAVVPIRYGVGIQNKVLEALALATPVVTSMQACVALNVTPGEDLLVADSAEGLAQQTLMLLEDAALRERIGANGRRYVEAHHAWPSIINDLVTIYRQAVSAR